MIKQILKIIITGIILLSTVRGQSSLKGSNSKLELGYGNSTYKNVKTRQYLFIYKIKELDRLIDNLGIDTDFNFEVIQENKKSTIILGIVPMFRYNFALLEKNFFLKGGIGANYINSHNIGNRNTGSHFIFSDMISIGFRVYQGQYYNIELSYLFRHVSNAGIYKNNEGFNSQYMVVSLEI